MENTMSNTLQGKTAFITGASRGIGAAMALRLADAGCNIVVAAKTSEPHPKLAGTIHETVRMVEERGAKGLACIVDVRDPELIQAAVDKAVETFGGIDILINNASAISLTGTMHTKTKRYDLMHQVNVRGTFLCSQACIPHLLKSENPHILNISPPLNLDPKWFGRHVAYTMTKYGMSMCVLGMAEEFKGKIAINALWPQTAIATAAVEFAFGGKAMMQRSRKPSIMADAAHWVLSQDVATTGEFFIDEVALKKAGITDLSDYAVDPTMDLLPDFFV
jgi:citronellol/citronellal dehydrogenase